MATVQGMAALERRLKAIGEARPMLRVLQIATVAEAQARVPRKTGHLQRSIRPGPVYADYAIVEAKTPYAAAVEFGSKPHVIRPKNRKALAWTASGAGRRLSGRARVNAGAFIFAGLVNHPGTKAKPYLVPGAKAAVEKGKMRDVIVTRWNEAA